jgi:hypothetical protein
MAIRGDDAMAHGTTTTVSRRVLAFDAVLVAAGIGTARVLADHLPAWAVAPVAAAVVVNGLVVGAAVRAFTRTSSAPEPTDTLIDLTAAEPLTPVTTL